MGRNIIWARIVIACLLMVFLSLAWMGCSSIPKEKRGVPMKGKDVGVGKYYHFDDILIPKELNYEPSESFVHEFQKFRTGFMVFKKWWVDSGSLVDFFLYHMEKDNWTLVNSFEGKESILNFSKPDKTCTINIIDEWYGTTVVEVQVGLVGMKKM
jgi:hypothetical protein